MDRGAWRATVHGVAKSQTRLNDQHTHTLDDQPGGLNQGSVLFLADEQRCIFIA